MNRSSMGEPLGGLGPALLNRIDCWMFRPGPLWFRPQRRTAGLPLKDFPCALPLGASHE